MNKAVVSLNRPKKRNAIDSHMWKEIGDAFRLIGSTGDGCRCVLLVGKGKAFCSGIDISDPNFGFLETNEKDDVDVARRYLSFRYKILEMQRALTEIENCAVPVVAAIHGACIGGGIDLTCCADVRLCSQSAYFGIRETRLGLAADVGTLQRFPKIVAGGSSRARELCYTGENFHADEAAKIGFVSRVSSSEKDLLQDAMEICKKIAGNSPVAVSGTKLSLNYSRDHSVSEGLEHIAMHNAAALMTDDLAASFMSKSRDDTTFVNLLAHSKL